MNHYTEDALVEQPAIELLQSLGWEFKNCMQEHCDADRKKATLGRTERNEVVLVAQLDRYNLPMR